MAEIEENLKVPNVFDIHTKEENPDALRRWRKATLVLNASRRFRYTAKLASDDGWISGAAGGGGASGGEGRHGAMTPAQRFRKSGHALMAVQRFQKAGRERNLRLAVQEDFGDGFGLTAKQLVELNEDATVETLKDIGGVAGLCRALRVSPEQGIKSTEEDLQKRKDTFGSNTYPAPKSKSWLIFAWEAAQDKTLIILMVCAIVSLVAGMISDGVQRGWYDGVAIAFAIILVILVTATSDYIQGLQFKGLNAEKANIQLKVVRDGRVQTVSIFSLVVGDVVPLSIGDQVPGDGVFLSGHSLVIDESSMTGESEPIHKSADQPFMLSGCKVVDGVGHMVITAVGMNTEWGKVMATLNDGEESETPLQVRLNGLATGIGKLGLVVAGLVLIILLIRYFVALPLGQPASVYVKDITDILIIAITIVVVAVPEGLPLAVTLTLAFSMYKMMADKALVRRLSACETMGCATAICSDKTGTLTLNQMTVVQEWLGGEVRPCETGPAPGGLLLESVEEGVTQNGTATVYINEEGLPEVTASPTEAAVVSWALKFGLEFNSVKSASSVVGMVPFNSTKKRGGVVAQRPDGSARVHWKGAAEIIAGLCSSWMAFDGTVHPLDDTMQANVDKGIQSMAADSLRCVALAYRELSASEKPSKPTEDWPVPESNLTLLAIVGIKDPCRPGVPEAVATCQRAGVKVRMVTGDNVLTARAIAAECGILTLHGVVIEGKDFRALNQEEMHALLPNIDVMARSSPTDKHLMVQNLRMLNEVVAVTGDGTNDAPALKEADIGLSMGISGTEVAKESSDIVILDDNFTSIVKVVCWGRSVFANLQKFIQFQLTVNVAALALNFVVACTNGTQIPLTAVQMLWVNLIMDTLAALALATEPPTPDLLMQKPVGRKAPLITNVMWRNLILMALYQIIVLLVIYYEGVNMFNLSYLGPEEAGAVNRTIIFNAFVLCQLFNEINARKPNEFNVFKGLFRNWLFIIVLVVSLIMQVVMVEFLNNFASTRDLNWSQWLICIIIGAISLPLAALFKLIPVPKTPFLVLLLPKKWHERKGAYGRSISLDDGTGPHHDGEVNGTASLAKENGHANGDAEAPPILEPSATAWAQGGLDKANGPAK